MASTSGTGSFALTEVYRARQIVSRYLQPTPLLRSRILSEELGCDLWVKYENCTPIRSFKGRGGIYRASTLGLEIAGMATASTGNHGQGIAWGASVFGKRAVVVAPAGANPFKLAAMRALGAEVIEEGETLAAANDVARAIAADQGLLYVEDGEDPDVMLGCATLALEIVEQQPALDDLVVQLGGGNLIGACALVLDHAAPQVRLNGVQSDAAPASYQSWKAGEPILSPRCDTFAGGVATSYPGHFTFDYWKGSVDEVHLVSDEDLVDAALVMLRATGHLPEGAGAAALAGVLADPDRYRGRTVVVLLSGGNAEPLIWDRLRS
jgi:threonine dehydratase